MGGWSTSPSSGSGFTGTYGSGTITTSTPISFTQTWNASGVTFKALQVNVTETAAAAASLIADFQSDGTTRVMIGRKDSNNNRETVTLGTGLLGLSQYAGRLGFGSLNGPAFSIHDTNSQLTAAAGGGFGISPGNPLSNTNDIVLMRAAAGVFEVTNGTAGTRRDMKLRDLTMTPSATVTPAANGDLVVEATSNTTLTFKLKGSDGTVRSATLTLA